MVSTLQGDLYGNVSKSSSILLQTFSAHSVYDDNCHTCHKGGITIIWFYSVRSHIVHLSAASALPHIREAQKDGAPLTVETCPHYLTLTSDKIPDGKPEYKCCPPIRSQQNQVSYYSFRLLLLFALHYLVILQNLMSAATGLLY